MKIVNFGSINIDKVYHTAAFVEPGETIFAKDYQIFPGGKGLNQSIAAARAGADVLHAGIFSEESRFLMNLLESSGVDVSKMVERDAPAGHAMIEVNEAGQNRIIVFGGTNQLFSKEYILDILDGLEKDSLVLLQNEVNLVDFIIKNAHERGLKVAFNPSPFPQSGNNIEWSAVDYFIINEIEGANLADLPEGTNFEEIRGALQKKYPDACIIMTLGGNGVMYFDKNESFFHPIFKVTVADTTAAGDTFCGFFFSAICQGKSIPTALEEAAAAAAIAVSRPGAAPSIPLYSEVETFLQ